MEDHSTNSLRYAGPIIHGVWANAKRNVADLFRWHHRVPVEDENGNLTHTEWKKPDEFKNPLSLLAGLSMSAWIHFIVGFFAWTADAFDFHGLSIQQVKLAEYFGKTKTQISLAITLTLLLRSVGAAFFGLAGDRWGRKWPLVVNMVILGALQIASIYCKTYGEFVAVRALFGLFMGGVYGNAVATGLENATAESRGLLSGFLQQGYAFGYVLAACTNLGVGGKTDSWKLVFWVGAALSFGVALARLPLSESKQFLEAKAQGEVHQPNTSDFWKEFKAMMKVEWKRVIYCILMMTAFNYYSHTSQDNYTTFMLVQKEMANSGATRTSILMKTGACVGGIIIGWASQFLGRRRAIVISAIVSMCLIPAWILPTSEASLSASGFMMQFFVQGAWGVIPVHLNELSPPAFRSSFPGVTYQLGNMISSPSAQIVNAIAEKHHIHAARTGDVVEAYGPTMGIATAIIAFAIVVIVGPGPEWTGRHFETALRAGATREVHGKDITDEEKGPGDNPASIREEKI